MGSPKKAASRPRKPATHPSYNDMVIEAIKDNKTRKGASRQAIVSFVSKTHDIPVNTANSHVKLALKRLTANEMIVHSSGIGASGSFKLGEKAKLAAKKAAAPKKPKAKAATKPKAKKPAKKPAAKKTTKPKKATGKKSAPAKKKTTAKKPAAKKTTAKKPAAKKTAKKPAAKKTAKKAAPKK